MRSILANIGLFTITLLILYIMKKTDDYLSLKKTTYVEDMHVYKAARAFAEGAPIDEIKNIMTECFDFDTEDTEDILSQALLHKNDIDGGYTAFITTVNKAIGKEVYHNRHISL